MGKSIRQRREPPSQRREPPSLADIERILAFLDERGGGSLRDIIASGQFIPDVAKWDEAIQRSVDARAIADARPSQSNSDATHAPENVQAAQKTEPSEATRELRVSICDSQPWRDIAVGADEHRADIVSFLREKWLRITLGHAHFGFDPTRTYPVEVTAQVCRVALGLTSIQYASEGQTAAETGVTLFILGATIAGRIDSAGNLHLTSDHPELTSTYRLLLNLAVVLHYYDLVMRRESRQSETTTPRRSGSSGTEAPSAARVARPIPRALQSGSHTSTGPSLRRNVPEHFVDPFRRRLTPGHTPTFAKIVEADQYGINLQGPGYPEVQYTFVREHTRGASERILDRAYRHTYEAARTLDTILTMFGTRDPH